MSVTGIVLAGGKSSRMGSEKGLVLLNGKPLIRYAIESLAPLCDRIIISSNSDDYNNMGFEVVADEIQNIGPMGGLLSSLKKSTTEKNLVLSCDLPFANHLLLAYILQMSIGYDAAVPWQGNQHFEPLCAFYNKSVLNVMEQFVMSQNYKLPDLFENINIKKLIINNMHSFYSDRLFFNVNSKTDITQAEIWMKIIK